MSKIELLWFEDGRVRSGSQGKLGGKFKHGSNSGPFGARDTSVSSPNCLGRLPKTQLSFARPDSPFDAGAEPREILRSA